MKKIRKGIKFILFILMGISLFIISLNNNLFAQGNLKATISHQNNMNGQQADRWFFGQNAALDFRPQNPEADLTNILLNVPTSPAIMADSNGNILFFTDGIRVYDRLGDTMPNGNGLHGYVGLSMPVLIVPRPGNDSIYYIFTTHRPKMNPNDPQTIYGLELNEVNLNMNGGFGSITTKNKVLLEPEVSSKLSAVKHSNGIDYWVVAHKFNSDEFCSFRVTSDGVDTTNYVSSNIGTIHAAPGETNNMIGYMKISPDGTKLVLAVYGSATYEIFDFDASTGKVTNVITSAPIFDEAYGIEFSPDSRYFYGSTTPINFPNLYDTITEFSFIFKFDVNMGISIFNSYDTIAFDSVGSYFGGIQLGTDGRIYVSRSPYGNTSLSVIQNPKRQGEACNFVSNAIDLKGRMSRFGLPNFIQSYFDLPHFDVENICFTDTTVFIFQNNFNIDNIIWLFGDPESGFNTSTDIQPNHVFSGPGTYTVEVSEYFNGIAYGPYIEMVNISELPSVDLGDTIYMSPGSSVILNPGEGYHSYVWSTGETTPQISISEPGIYKVTVQNSSSCSETDSGVVNYYAQINEGNENRPICSIYPNPGDGTLHLLFYPGAKEAVVSVSNLAGQTIWGPCHYNDLEIREEIVLNFNDLANGVYFIHVKDDNRVSIPMKYFLLK